MITKNFIKQCEGAKEIQKAWKKKKSHIEDKIYIKESNGFLLVTKEFEYEYDGGMEYFIFQRAESPPEPIPFTKWNREAFYRYDDGELNMIYLPTQEQLQEMILNHGYPGYDNSNISVTLSLFSMDYRLEDLTFTELWLAFVMKAKYNKIWTGKKWNKEVK